jgi:hypothetical protein
VHSIALISSASHAVFVFISYTTMEFIGAIYFTNYRAVGDLLGAGPLAMMGVG